jgi:hypothetical protein
MRHGERVKAQRVGLLLLALAACGRGTPTDVETLGEVQARWLREHAGRPQGQATSLQGAGAPLVLALQEGTVAEVPTPVLVPHVAGASGLPLAVFTGAQVGGQTGTLALDGARLVATAGTLRAVAVGAVEVPGGGGAVRLTAPPRVDAASPSARLPDSWRGANEALPSLRPVDLQVEGLALAGFSRAVLVTATGTTELTAPVVLASAERLYWDGRSTLEAAGEVRVRGGRFALGGALARGTLEGSALPAPPLLTGASVEATLRPAGGDATLQLTQGLSDAGVLARAEVELALSPYEEPVEAGAPRRVGGVFRERSLRADALLAGVRVTGEGSEAVSVRVSRPSAPLSTLLGSPAAAPALPALPALTPSPALLLQDGDCRLTCFDALPSWLPAGQVGQLELRVEGRLPPGAYAMEVELTGHNFPPVRAPLRFTVR